MVQWCDSCGQLVPDDHGSAASSQKAPEPGLWLDEAAPASATARAGVKPTQGREKKLIGVAVVLALVWGGFVGVSRLVSPGTSIDNDTAARMEQNRVDGEVEAALEAAVQERLAELDSERETTADADEQISVDAPADSAQPGGAYADADAAPGVIQAATVAIAEGKFVAAGDVPLVATPTRMPRQAQRVSRSIESQSGQIYVAYPSFASVVLIDLVSTQAWVLEPPSAVTVPEPNAPLLRTETSTYAFDPSTGQMSLVGANASLVVSETLDGATYVVDAATLNGQARIVEVIDDGQYDFYRTPNGGYQLAVVDGLGVFAVPAGDGQTLFGDPNGFVESSPNRLITGSAGGVVEEVCQADDGCTLAVRTMAPNGSSRPLPADFARFGDSYALAPNGESIIRHSSSGYGEILDVESGSIAWVTGAGMHRPTWSPDSRFVAWIDLIGEPELEFRFMSDRSLLSINLADYGVPAPTGQELVVFSGTSNTSN